MKIDGIDYLDGGIIANNPVKYSFEEVCQMHAGRPSLVLSIGTGVPASGSEEIDSLGGRLSWGNILKLSRQLLTQTEGTHREFHLAMGRIQTPKPSYLRLNVPQLRDIGLDHWKPRTGDVGAESKRKMLEKTITYLAQSDVHDEMVWFARELVFIRRMRAETDRWEQFACTLIYLCPLCVEGDYTPHFDTRHGLRKHALDTHSINCGNRKHHLDKDIYDRACITTLKQTNAHSNPGDYLRAMKRAHVGPCPLPDRRDVEAWLDEARHDRDVAFTQRKHTKQAEKKYTII
jgi:hypothetical protein